MASTVKHGQYATATLFCVVSITIVVLLFIMEEPGSRCAPLSAFVKRYTSDVCCHCYSDESVPPQVLSKELVIRRVYLDPRRRDGYCNSVVFLLEAKGTKINSLHFLGCRVGHYFSHKFHFRLPHNYEFVKLVKHATSTLAVIDCYNVPEIGNGDSASLYYNRCCG